MSIKKGIDEAFVELMTQDRVHVPPFPAVAAQLTRVVSKSDYSLDELADIVAQDQVLATTVLRHANSARYAGGREITALKPAIGRLGAEDVHQIAWAASLGKTLRPGGPLAELEELLWRQSVASAFLCQRLALLRGLNAPEAFTCGLVHRIGRAVALECLKIILAEKATGATLPIDAWLEIIDQYEDELGLVVSARWNLPPTVTEMIVRHRTPHLAAAGERALAEVMATADEVVDLLEAQVVHRESLARSRGLGGAREVDEVLSFLPQLAELMSALIEAPPGGKQKARGPDPISRPETTLEGSLWPADLPAAVVHRQEEQTLRVKGVTKTGVLLHCDKPMVERTLNLLAIRSEGDPFEVWATVTLCVTEPHGGYRIEARLFAPGGDALERWLRLVIQLRSASSHGSDPAG